MECKICSKRFSGIENFRQHEVSERHKKNVLLHQQMNGRVDSSLPPKFQMTAVSNSSHSCNVCAKSFCSLSEFFEHSNSEEHAIMILKRRSSLSNKEEISTLNESAMAVEEFCPVKNQAELNKSFNETSLVKEDCIVTSTQTSDQPYFSKCSICDKTFTGVEPYQQHIDSKAHKKKAGSMADINTNSTVGSDTLESKNMYCSVCSEGFLTKDLFLLHINTDGHKNSAKRAFSSNTINCEICRISVFGPIPYNQHINSESHKKKAKMVGSQSEVDDGVNMNAAAIAVASRNISMGPYFCGVCDIPCSGPDPFRAHINSKRHIKKVGEAELLSKYKAMQNLSSNDSRLNVDFGNNKIPERTETGSENSFSNEDNPLKSVNISELDFKAFMVNEAIDLDKKIDNIVTIDIDKIEKEESMDEDIEDD